jgi:Tol biopolymer transport system component
VTLNREATTTVRVAFQLDCSSASLISDAVVKSSGRLTFLAGQRSKDIIFDIKPDTSTEQLETILQQITASFGPLTVLEGEGAASIIDDDGTFAGFGIAIPGFETETLPASSGFDLGTVGDIEQVSIANDGSPAQYIEVEPGNGNRLSDRASLSADGRFAVFRSDAINLVPGDTNNMRDVFVRDRLDGTTERVSVHPGGVQIEQNEASTLQGQGATMWAPSISADGRYVEYTTAAPLIPSDTTTGSWVEYQDAYVFDRTTGAVELVSAMPDGTSAGGVFSPPSISANGRYVAFEVNDDSSRYTDGDPTHDRVFVRDRVAGTTTMVFDGPAQKPVISANGRYVALAAIGPACPVGPQLVVVDLLTGDTDRADVTDDEQAAEEGDFSDAFFAPSISADGRYVSFMSFAWNLVPGMTGPLTEYSGAFPSELVHPYLRDRAAGTTTLLGMQGSTVPSALMYSDESSVADDGQTVARGHWTGGPAYLFDVTAGTVSDIGEPYGPTAPGAAIQSPAAMSGDGRYVAFMVEQWPYGDVFVQRVA